MQSNLEGRSVLVTQATEFMGPVICEVFAERGADVVRSERELSTPDGAQSVVRLAGEMDVLVVNLSLMAPLRIQVNAIAQNFVDNPTYLPPVVQANPGFRHSFTS